MSFISNQFMNVTFTLTPPLPYELIAVAAGPDYCAICGSKKQPMFNMVGCHKGCATKATPEPIYPLWWSHWAGTPIYVKEGNQSIAQDMVTLADAVVVFQMEGGWTNANIPGHEVYVVKNLTWDSTVGKFYRLTERQEQRLCIEAMSCAESIKALAPRAVSHMACLKRA